MKSLTAVCQTGAASMPAINTSNGRIARHPPHRGDGENAEMKMYLSKLKDLVPFMPKNRKLSKLEIIQHVIDYICDLQTELETHPDIGSFDAATALNFANGTLNAAAAAGMDDDDDDGDNVGGDNDNDNDDGDDRDVMMSERLGNAYGNGQQHQQQQQQHSSPATTMSATPIRQPLIDRQAPNTILPATPTTPISSSHSHSHNSSTTASSASASASAAAASITTSAMVSVTSSAHAAASTATSAKDSSSRHSC